jgi:hypothetical protein
VAGVDTSLLSGSVVRTECVAGSLSQRGASVLALHFSIPYDSLIEKCSTLPVV